jgi:hypothetical protein
MVVSVGLKYKLRQRQTAWHPLDCNGFLACRFKNWRRSKEMHGLRLFCFKICHFLTFENPEVGLSSWKGDPAVIFKTRSGDLGMRCLHGKEGFLSRLDDRAGRMRLLSAFDLLNPLEITSLHKRQGDFCFMAAANSGYWPSERLRHMRLPLRNKIKPPSCLLCASDRILCMHDR